MQTLAPNPAALAIIAAFADLPADVLTWLGSAGELRQYADGEVIAPFNSPADRLLAIVSGAMQYRAQRHGTTEPVFRLEAGQVGGVLPYSRLQVFRGQAEAAGETTVYLLPRAEFAELEQRSPELVQRLVGVMSDRARDEVRGQERDDKLRALGKLAAGLAHELNNPAAAIVRAAAALATNIALEPALLRALLQTCPPAAALAALTASPPAPAAAASGPAVSAASALDRADAEDELADWLAAQGCPDGPTLSAGLLEAGHSPTTLEPLMRELPPVARPPALAWLEGHLSARRLTQNLHEAGQRISTLVGNVKTYAHLDRAGGREPLDLTGGLDSTLNIFGHAIRGKSVRLTRASAPDLPVVLGRAGELNQVWTNLIGNALDALPTSGGELTVRVEKQNGGVCVSILDNGSGIAPEVLTHMFEPFYTTKPAGEGSGLGLDIARRIVREHGGRLEARSEPSRTEFSVWLPVE